MKKRKQGTAVRHSRTQAHARSKPRAPAGKPARAAHGTRRNSPPNRVGSARSKRGRRAVNPAGAFVLSADCTVAETAALKSTLLEVLREPEPVTLDIAAVQRIDTAGIQLLAAFVRERESLGLKVEWRGAAPVFTSAARLLGVASVLGLPEPLA